MFTMRKWAIQEKSIKKDDKAGIEKHVSMIREFPDVDPWYLELWRVAVRATRLCQCLACLGYLGTWVPVVDGDA